MDLQVIFFEVIRGFDCTILEGYRNEHDQELAYQAGNTTLHYPNGKHNSQPSMAVDAAPYPLDWYDKKRFYYFGGYVMGIAQRLRDEGKITYGLRFGGDWDQDKDLNDQKLIDLVHFELI